jgi:hypothetical protein
MAKAVYNPETGKVACVLLQAVYRGDLSIPQLFKTEDWELGPVEGQRMFNATKEQWEFIASLSKQERIERFRKAEKGEK